MLSHVGESGDSNQNEELVIGKRVITTHLNHKFDHCFQCEANIQDMCPSYPSNSMPLK